MINITFYGECLINNTSRVCFPPLSRPEPPPHARFVVGPHASHGL